ncbi:MAG: hypothetical protein KQH63_04975 [Desulfobulbaceae bacterium]|nr:hypothetical protein [Desulfobulbaceae bacterium]
MMDDKGKRNDGNQEKVIDYDPHKSKIDPDDPQLAITSQTRTGRKIKKSRVFGVAAAFVGLLLIALIIALQPPKIHQAIAEVELETKQKYVQVPDLISKAPAAVVAPLQPEQKNIPQLGPALPGDIGKTMVKPPLHPSLQSTPVTVAPTPEEEMRKQREQKAYLAEAVFRGGYKVHYNNAGIRDSGKMNSQGSDLPNALLDSVASLAGNPQAGTVHDSVALQNMQSEKRTFMDSAAGEGTNYLNSPLTWPRSKYEVKAGSIIPVSLITGINSDLPGDIVGQVRENVYDTVTGNYLLIPQGSRVMADYDSIVTYGQERALVCWNRLIRPDGTSIHLECSPGVDLAGYAGVKDQVDNHWFRLVSGVVLSSVLAATTTFSEGDIDGYNPTWSQQMAASAGEEINNVGQQITRKNLNIQPTLRIRPGFSVNVLVNKDMILPPYEREG